MWGVGRCVYVFVCVGGGPAPGIRVHVLSPF